MSPLFHRGALCAVALVALCAPAFAHVTLERPTATQDTGYRGVLRVGHGCGDAPTTAISVEIPEGVLNVRPMPKPGWTLEIARAPFRKSYSLWGHTVTEGPRRITWSGNTLPDDQYDEFVFIARVTDDHPAGSTVYFPVVQTCGAAKTEWTQIPVAGAAVPPRPAPGVLVEAKAPAAVAQATGGHDMSAHAAAAAPSDMAAASYRVGALLIEQPWLRATPGGARVAGGYLRVTNTGTEPDRLVGATIPIAARGEVHEMSMEAGVMKMHEVEGGLVIAPGATVELKPGGFHLMFMDLTAPAKAGETVAGTLTFAKAGTVKVTFPVAGMGAQGPASRPSN